MSDFLDSDEFKNAMKAYWVTSLNWHAKLDTVKALIREKYPADVNHRTIKEQRAKIRELEAWVDRLTAAPADANQA